MSSPDANRSGPSDQPLVLGIPSKGRLQEATMAYFKRAGLSISKKGGDRDYRGLIKGLDGVEVAFLSASEIAGELAAGTVHLGVTGMDLVHEKIHDPEEATVAVKPLGFGNADVVVAVPDSWIDVQTMDDLEDVAAGFRARHGRRMRLATKYVRLTRKHFRANGVADYRIVESLGATEGAPASGAADLIVDITTTGATLTANHLRILSDGVILRSEANLVASKNADWSEVAEEGLKAILSRIAARDRAATVYEVRTAIGEQTRVFRDVSQEFGCTAPFGAVAGQGSLVLHVDKARIWDLVAYLKARGASSVTVGELAYVVDGSADAYTPVFEALGLSEEV
ncbi:MAG: ATP phosphoribosyltransferase [Cohaesibacteraceae bacterium]